MIGALLLSACCSAGPGQLEPLSASIVRAHADRLRVRHGFAIVEVPPFVVVGGGRRQEVEGYAHEVVGWAYEALQRQLFDRHPSQVVEVWALRTSRSYAAWADEAIGTTPGSPYGVYVPCAGAILVNRGLGDGTLVHEIVHVLVEVDFPGAPTWLDEGLGSLYERPGERDGRIVGLVNWRLPPLQRALRRGTAPRLRDVMRSSRGAFYGDGAGLHYAVARHLMLYLQEQHRLGTFYRRLRDGSGDGEHVLEAVMGSSMTRIEEDWAAFVAGLRW